MSPTEIAVSLTAIAALFLGGTVLFINHRNRRPRLEDRAYHASLMDARAAYSDEGVYGDVPFVPARPEGGAWPMSFEVHAGSEKDKVEARARAETLLLIFGMARRECNAHLGWMNDTGPCGSFYCDACKIEDEDTPHD